MDNKQQPTNWFKRIGVAGFLFFLIKGIIWLIALYAAGKLFK